VIRSFGTNPKVLLEVNGEQMTMHLRFTSARY
jgi:hypothetical protein